MKGLSFVQLRVCGGAKGITCLFVYLYLVVGERDFQEPNPNINFFITDEYPL